MCNIFLTGRISGKKIRARKKGKETSEQDKMEIDGEILEIYIFIFFLAIIIFCFSASTRRRLGAKFNNERKSDHEGG